MMNTRLILLLVALATGILRAQNVSGTLIPFQGRLTDQLGTPRTNGTYTLVFNLYDQAVGGSNLWTERHERVGVVNGMVNVFLGSITSLDGQAPGVPGVDFSSTRYLGITVDADNNSNTSDPEMVPRQMIIPAFWARNSDNSRLLAGADWSSILVSGNNPSNGFIRGVKIQPNSITGGQIAPRAIGATALAPGAVTSAAIAADSVGFTNRMKRGTAYVLSGGRVGDVVFSQAINATVVLSESWQEIPSSRVEFTSVGGPALACITPYQVDAEGVNNYISIKQKDGDTDDKIGVSIGLFDGSVLVCRTTLYLSVRKAVGLAPPATTVGEIQALFPTTQSMLITTEPGSHSYVLKVRTEHSPGAQLQIGGGRLGVIEL
jgi:hypothetical protein